LFNELKFDGEYKSRLANLIREQPVNQLTNCPKDIQTIMEIEAELNND